VLGKVFANQFADGGVVIDDENVGFHGGGFVALRGSF
jgi:hypothetical protein